VEDADIDKVNDVLKNIEALNDSNIKGTENQFEFQRSKENTPIYAVGLIVLMLVILNVFVVLLVVRLLLKTVFVKREKEFGIKKALGFTSLQLRYQLSLSLIPSTLLAATVGALAGYLYSNPLLAAVLSNYGLKVSRLIIHPDFMVVPAATVPVLVFIFSFIMSGRMKKISAYKLIQE
jgi:ABC-type antimicrobial peptide transport system permease subunit